MSAEVDEDGVDRVGANRRGGQNDLRSREQDLVAGQRARDAELGRQIFGAEEQRGNLRVRTGDRRGTDDAARRFEKRNDAARWRGGRDALDVLLRLGLGDARPRRCGPSTDATHFKSSSIQAVRTPLTRTNRAGPDAGGEVSHSPIGSSSLGLAARLDAIFEIEDDGVCPGGHGLGKPVGPGARHEEDGPQQRRHGDIVIDLAVPA